MVRRTCAGGAWMAGIPLQALAALAIKASSFLSSASASAIDTEFLQPAAVIDFMEEHESATEPVQHLVEGDRSVDLDPYALERLAFDNRISGHLLCLSSGEFNKRFLCGAAAELRPGHAKDVAQRCHLA